ncbi:hypothetical protein GCM10028807_55060 [Spirosoma daeguense]
MSYSNLKKCSSLRRINPKSNKGNNIIPTEGVSLVSLFLGKPRKEREGNLVTRQGNGRLFRTI